jgi:hypothetical protein
VRERTSLSTDDRLIERCLDPLFHKGQTAM